jgi:hypothetical protein
MVLEMMRLYIVRMRYMSCFFSLKFKLFFIQFGSFKYLYSSFYE